MYVNNVSSSANLYSSNLAATRYANSASSVRGVRKSDEFTPSAEAQSFSEMLNKLKNTSDVRQDKINALQAQIAAGQYSVPAETLAASLLTNRF
ncbi:MAG: flagellar biosynthesis anti-sigma factor FlgM [Selenomonadaceae bacterium]|nr:flagellar biosynthesis anti-sigma factor FlgM [Selenomonadaceae bacterium]